jgi:hypothetical protein
MAPFTREATLFAGIHGLLEFRGNAIGIQKNISSRVERTLRCSTAEVRSCADKSMFVGRWIAKAGNTETVLSLLGVRP